MTTAKLLTVASLEVNSDAFFGGLLQLVEHLLCKQGVSGSSPLFSIHKYLIMENVDRDEVVSEILDLICEKT